MTSACFLAGINASPFTRKDETQCEEMPYLRINKALSHLAGLAPKCETNIENKMKHKYTTYQTIDIEYPTNQIKINQIYHSNLPINQTIHIKNKLKHKLSYNLTTFYMTATVAQLIQMKLMNKLCLAVTLLLLLSGDIELNPGPVDKQSSEQSLVTYSQAEQILNQRLANIELTALEVGGGGDCFFRAVSHQLYGNPNYHAYIRCQGIQYMTSHPERFRNFLTNTQTNNWTRYVNNMARSGTWCDNLIIQAVADTFNVIIIIVESELRFAPLNVIEPRTYSENARIITIGHLLEIHYVSTVRPPVAESRNQQSSGNNNNQTPSNTATYESPFQHSENKESTSNNFESKNKTELTKEQNRARKQKTESK